ncbi:RNA polymerase factor sigma-54 [Haloimpatiens lingqiaonensis]|uniref:RNA polymerase factor sigma-54 n=1 Tax=Haloimpatiens lingqiaonensis TaxID=1380675 RepID=UPI0010FE0A4E|nr:RNA polymerase factor sigma-54 [Haloimpatiens lingqiaonensis]
MKLDFNLKLTQEQKLVMTQQMQLSIKMLQMSGFELQQYIEKEMQENPVLDANYSEENHIENNKDKIDYKKFIEYLEFDNYSSKNYVNTDDEEVSPFNFITNEKSLKDFLEEQILELHEDEYTKEICRYIVGNLDARGYLDNTIENMAKEIHANKENLEYALGIVQGLEPYGIGCRDLKECLKIQLKNKNIENEKLLALIDNYLELLAENKIADIAKKLSISVQEAQKYTDLIKTLEPKPSRGFYTGESVKYIIPDAYIRKINDEYHIIMNDSVLPKLNINPVYKSIILNGEKKDGTVEYVKDKINSAMFLMKSIEQRKSTIYKVLEEILKRQRDFFEYGKEHLKPMTLKEVANEIQVHESTVSRAIKDKYIYTNIGTIKIKDLFTTAISSVDSGEDVSVVKIKNRIEEYVNKEDKKKPLSDQKICDMLIEEGMNISRRTVAKYREELGIKSSSKRKRF